jgi:DmsE family decaheme c-type cytochrome
MMTKALLSWLACACVAALVVYYSAQGQDDSEPTLDDDEYAALDDEGAEDQPSLPWQGESPFWTYGQEFSAVTDAPFIGTAECLYCHTALKAGFMKTAHARSLNNDEMPLQRQGCEGCHGAGGAHAVLRSRGAIFAFDWKDPTKETRICLRCHEWLSTPEEWDRLSHTKAGLRCSTCHDPHVGRDHRYRFMLNADQDGLCASCHADVAHDFSRLSHHPVVIDAQNDPGARALHCTDCHDVHAGPGPRMLAERRITDLCAKCHVEKAAPFRYTHPSNDEGLGQGCLTCHLPHGSDEPWLAVAEGRAVCEQCHTDRLNHYQPLSCYAAGCHVSMHGSNRSPLFMN